MAWSGLAAVLVLVLWWRNEPLWSWVTHVPKPSTERFTVLPTPHTHPPPLSPLHPPQCSMGSNTCDLNHVGVWGLPLRPHSLNCPYPYSVSVSVCVHACVCVYWKDEANNTQKDQAKSRDTVHSQAYT